MLEKRPIINHHIIEVMNSQIQFNVDNIVFLTQQFIQDNSLISLKMFVYQFKPMGLTIIHILSASHLVLHTWPELKYIHIDIMRCDKLPDEETKKQLKSSAKKIFQSDLIKVVRVNTENEIL